jgi:hypothetical protein
VRRLRRHARPRACDRLVPGRRSAQPFHEAVDAAQLDPAQAAAAQGLPASAGTFDRSEPIGQARHDDFNMDSSPKIEEKRASMHLNPVRVGLVRRPCDWPWSSARSYESGRSVGVPVGWLDGRLLRPRRPDNKLSGPPLGQLTDRSFNGIYDPIYSRDGHGYPRGWGWCAKIPSPMRRPAHRETAK